MKLNEMIGTDLPLLQSIQLGEYALCGKDDVSCSLIMRSNNKMFWKLFFLYVSEIEVLLKKKDGVSVSPVLYN